MRWDLPGLLLGEIRPLYEDVREELAKALKEDGHRGSHQTGGDLVRCLMCGCEHVAGKGCCPIRRT